MNKYRILKKIEDDELFYYIEKKTLTGWRPLTYYVVKGTVKRILENKTFYATVKNDTLKFSSIQSAEHFLNNKEEILQADVGIEKVFYKETNTFYNVIAEDIVFTIDKEIKVFKDVEDLKREVDLRKGIFVKEITLES